jgi:hypothetical protein
MPAFEPGRKKNPKSINTTPIIKKSLAAVRRENRERIYKIISQW